MTAMSSTVKSAIFYSAIGIAVVVGIMFFIINVQSLRTMFFQRTADEENGGSDYLGGSVPTLGYLIHSNAIVPVGEEASFDAHSKFGKAPYTFEWKFSDGLTLTGENVTRSFDSPGRYFFNLTIADGNGDKVTSSQRYTDIVQEKAGNERINSTTLRLH
jgi:PKD domain